jgi:hypothetical protein
MKRLLEKLGKEEKGQEKVIQADPSAESLKVGVF